MTRPLKLVSFWMCLGYFYLFPAFLAELSSRLPEVNRRLLPRNKREASQLLKSRVTKASPILACLLAALLGSFPARANEKPGMPDLSQIEQTCLPTSTANLIIWFGRHGYPKLILDGANEDERDLHTVHRIMTDTDARFDWGTRMDAVTVGIEKYIREAGYECDVEYRGLDGKGAAFSQDWLQENDEPNKGFILLLAYCHQDAAGTFTPAWNAGHAVTLVNAEPDMLLIHDPAHDEDETGRKIITPHLVTEGTWSDSTGSGSAAGLLVLSGSLLEAPPNSEVLLVGAVCVTMHDKKHPAIPVASAPRAEAKSAAADSWIDWLFGLLFFK
jgi:hypothetical protein